MERVSKTDIEIKFSEEQALLLETAAEFARAHSPIAHVRKLMQSEDGYDKSVWKEMTELGWAGLAVPDEFGGSALGMAELVSIMEAMGRHLMASPLFAHTLAVEAITRFGSAPQKARWLPALAGGSIGTIALSEPQGGWDFLRPAGTAKGSGKSIGLSGTKRFVPFAAAASLFLVSVLFKGKAALAALSKEALPAGALTREICIDETQRIFALRLDGAKIDEADLIQGEDAIAQLARSAALLLAAEMCGGVSGTLDTTLEYVKTRKQFGRPIGSYQALKHPLASIFTENELARSLVYGAASQSAAPDGAMLAAMAKAKLSDLFVHAGDRAVQFHGGFGFSYDCDAGLYLRRALYCQSQFGDARHHRALLAATLLEYGT